MISKKCRSKKARRRSTTREHSIESLTEKIIEKKRGSTHYVTLTFNGFYDDSTFDNCRFVNVQLYHKQTNTFLTSTIVDTNPSETSKHRPSIRMPTEMLKITSSSGKMLNVTSATIQFRVKAIDVSSSSIETEFELITDAKALISNGNYELSFDETNYDFLTDLSPSKRQPSWQLKFCSNKSLSMSALNRNGINDVHGKSSKLKFHLKWSKELHFEGENKENNGTISNGKNRVFTRSRSTGSILSRSSSFTRSADTIQCLVYQFIHQNYRQKTEVWDRLKCPWCIRRMSTLYLLLKHLCLCHDRFKFKYVPGTSDMRIDVLINKKTEDMRRDPFSRFATKYANKEPARRPSGSTMLVWRPNRHQPRMSEFLWNFGGSDDRRRIYYSSTNALSIRGSGIDYNSDDEFVPEWLRLNTTRQIDDFVDVNDGEKEIMKMWNLHVMENRYICNAQMKPAILSFVSARGEEILSRNLYKNFIIHLCNLNDYHLISAKDIHKCTQMIREILVKNEIVRNIVAERIQLSRASSMLSREVTHSELLRPISETPRRKSDFNRKRRTPIDRSGKESGVNDVKRFRRNTASKTAANGM